MACREGRGGPDPCSGGIARRLGDEGFAALVTMLQESSRFSVDDAVNRASERFERRLASELTKMRLEFGTALADSQAALRKEFTVMYGELRKELHDGQGALRKELTVSQAELAEGDDERPGPAAEGVCEFPGHPAR